MRRVDLIDQTWNDYTAQLWSHKWWHKVLLFVTDSSLDNAYVLYKAYCLGRGQKRVMSQIQFHYEIAN